MRGRGWPRASTRSGGKCWSTIGRVVGCGSPAATRQAALGDLEGAIASVSAKSSNGRVATTQFPSSSTSRPARSGWRRSAFASWARRPLKSSSISKSADRKLTALSQLEPTSERLALRGSFHKKRATMLDDKARIDEFRAADHSDHAAELADPDPYSSLNRMQLGTLLDLPLPKAHRPSRMSSEGSAVPNNHDRPWKPATGPESLRLTPCSLASSKRASSQREMQTFM